MTENETLESFDLAVETPMNLHERHAIIVAGMHRSGTSALARVLSLTGCDLPQHLMPPQEDNKLGFWEPVTVAEAHDEYLASIGSSWDDVLPLPEDAFTSAAASELREQLSRLLLEEYAASPLFVVKDPRISRLLPLWLEVLEGLRVTPAIAIAVRNPLEVAGSLKARDGFTTTKSLLIWLRHTLESERDSRGRARSIVMYDDLLRDWRTVLSGVRNDLGLEWPTPPDDAAAEIEGFLTPGQRHHSFDWDTLEGRTDVVGWVKEAYFALRTDDPTVVLDQVAEELGQADIAFAPIVLDTRRALQTSEEQLRASEEQLLEQSRASDEQLRASEEQLRASEEQLRASEEQLRASEEQLRASLASRDELTSELEARRLQLEARDVEVRELAGTVERLTKALAVTERLVQQLEAALDSGPLRRLRRRSRTMSQLISTALPPTPQNLSLLGEFLRLRRSDEFDAGGYLARYPDVRGARINPVLHYVKAGRAEGRDPKPRAVNGRPVAAPAEIAAPQAEEARSQLPLKLTKELRAILEGEFDRGRYLSAYPDIQAAGVDPLEHYFNTGWREGRDPSAEFSTSYYLSANPDVAAAQVNPFAHYVLTGRNEGRPPRRPGGLRREMLETLRSVDEEIELFLETHPRVALPIADGSLTRLLAERLGTRRHVVISFSHDDYTRIAGGVELCVKLEEAAFVERGSAYINLHSAQQTPFLAREAEPEALTLAVVCDGELLGAASADAILSALTDLGSEGVDFGLVVHALHGHSPEVVAELYERLSPQWAWLWLHDFSLICPSTTLLRNKIEPCHAPPPESAGCMICVYGEERLRHVRRVGELLDKVPFKLAAPSQFMADRWREYFGKPELEVTVHEHGAMTPAATNASGDEVARAPVDGPARIAFLNQGFHKGWEVFRELARKYGPSGEYRFFHLVNGAHPEPYVEQRRVCVAEDGPHAMIDALRADAIDVAVLWSIVEESFSFTTREAFAAGVAVVTNEGSGNIASVVKASGNGRVFRDRQELFDAFEDGSILELVDSKRSTQQLEPVHFVHSNVTADLVHFDD